MTMTKVQCKEILKQAKKADACSSNYKPARKAYKAGNYDTFEKICRGNISWLDDSDIEFPAIVAGEYIYYYGTIRVQGVLNDHSDPVGIIIKTDSESGVLTGIEGRTSEGQTYYELTQQCDFQLKPSNKMLKAIADAIYKHLSIQPLQSKE